MSIAFDTRYGEGGYKAVVVASVLILLQFLMVSGRYYSRRMQKVMFEADDYVLLLATLFTFALCAIGITFPRIARAGTPTDATARGSKEEIKIVQASFIAWMVLYGASVTLSKCAILLLYLRVFTSSVKVFTVATCTIALFVLGTGIATVAGSLLQCKPATLDWNHQASGRCVDPLDFARYIAIPNVISGFAMLILPLPMVWRLNINLQQKIALTATFLHGIIGFVASISRLAILFEPVETRNTNSLAISWTIWTMVEPANYVIVACLPMLRPFLVRVLPQSFFILSGKRKSKGYSSIKISWPKGRVAPKINLATADIHGASHLTGPWESSRAPGEDLEANQGPLPALSFSKGSRVVDIVQQYHEENALVEGRPANPICPWEHQEERTQESPRS